MAEKQAQGAAVDATSEEVKTYVEAQRSEYGTYIAAQDITFNGVKAYRKGDPIPVSNVEKYGYDKDGSAVKVDNQAGQQIVKEVVAAGNPDAVTAGPVSLATKIK